MLAAFPAAQPRRLANLHGVNRQCPIESMRLLYPVIDSNDQSIDRHPTKGKKLAGALPSRRKYRPRDEAEARVEEGRLKIGVLCLR